MPTTGTDLKVERVKANVKIRTLAERMGLSRQAIWGLERSATVDEARVREYLAALRVTHDATETSGRA